MTNWIVLGLLILVVVVQVVVIWSIRRHRDPSLKIDCGHPIEALMPSLSGITLGSVVGGNRYEVLENGAFFDVVVDSMDQATQSVHFETFLWKDGQLGRRMAEAFIRCAKRGVQVRVLLDANGSKDAGDEVVERMRSAGCDVRFFHKVKLRFIGVLNDRDHRKIIVIDGRRGFVGGHCVVDDWLGNAEDGEHFSDVSLLLEGPIVHSLQGVFSENWAGTTGELFLGDDVFPPLEPQGDVPMHAVFAKPESSAPTVKILHHTVLCLARKRLWIQNPYFIPEPEAIEALGSAVKRGVDVRVLMPSTGGSDNPMVQYAGHRNFEKLLERGVRLFEYPHTLLHQKIMTVDGAWCAIGSSNFDDRSFETNDEITLSVLDARLADRLDGIFEKNAARATEVDLETWKRRPWKDKVKERVFYLFNELL